MKGKATAVLLGLIVACAFALRLRAADHPYISQWDEAYHALVAKNLLAHPLEPTLYEDKALPSDDRDWTKTRVWLHKPPLPLWLMAGGIAAFGEGELAFRLPAVLLDALAVLLVFLLAGELFGREKNEAGLIAAAVYALNPLMIRLVSGTVPDDTPHVINVFFVTATVLLFAVSARKQSRAYAAAAGLTLGLGTLCMSAVALLGLAAPLPLLFSKRGSWRLLACAAPAFLLSAAPWPLYAAPRWPDLWRLESAIQFDHLFHALDGHAHAWWWHASLASVHYGGRLLAAGVAAALVYGGSEAVRKKSPGLIAALLWVALPYAFFSLIATKLYAYACVAVPAVSLLAGFAGAAMWTSGRAGKAALAAALLLALAPRAKADYSVCPWNDLYDYPTFRRATTALKSLPGKKVVLNVGDSKAPQAMYYSGASAYPDAPTPALVRDLLARGYEVFVLLDERTRGAEFLPALKKAGLERKVRLYLVPAPLARPLTHPYEA